MIWMGVAGPKDWNALGNRFPVHYQRVATHLNHCLVTDLPQI
jgi:hypothetical protein